MGNILPIKRPFYFNTLITGSYFFCSGNNGIAVKLATGTKWVLSVQF
ncbi:hypothetical protein NT01EI_1764 [Edwardsiella ictaluri 93-146]|uniref:Uncharacterized protein n=1 Tax=Edwardsiella ictaluri (strain 93-146) TaxID=634503 RepID=C5BE23_EDWI9|nr:hypothetical protein NT01EI_1764 [Edwardsiella ictaluri 93-146]